MKTFINLCTADDGRIYVLWSERDASGEYDVYVSYSSNNGSTFSPAIRVNNEANGNQYYPSMATDDAGRLFVAWQDAYSDPGNIILSRSDDGGRTFQEIHVSNQEDGTQAYPDVAVNGNDVAIVWEEYRSDNTIRIWRGSNGAFVRELQGHTAAVRCVEYSPDGTKLASGAEDSMIKLWNPQTGNVIQNITDHTNSVMSLNWSRDGSMLATGSWDYKVIIFDTS
ncbi:MAG: BNR-4 repeat-containing protein, partial [Thermoplasmata archaeon]|nr:BNR-4 repeat-containing protein [Thermoplasmata archaeon]